MMTCSLGMCVSVPRDIAPLPSDHATHRRDTATRQRHTPCGTAHGHVDHLLSPATMLIVNATITVPNTYASKAWRSTWARIADVLTSLSDTWNVMPTVNAM